MTTEFKQLGQVNVVSAVSTTAYTQPVSAETNINSFSVVNNGGTATTVNVYIDDDGGVFNTTTRVFRANLTPNQTAENDSFRTMGKSSIGNIGIAGITQSINAITAAASTCPLFCG